MKNSQNIIAQLQAFDQRIRRIHGIVVHCSATVEGKDFDVSDIERWHKERGFNRVGYHFVIKLDGTIQTGRELSMIGAHVSGHNKNTIGICYIGGLDADKNAKDTRTDAQKESLRWLISAIKNTIKGGAAFTVKGHRDYSPDLNKDGIIQTYERIKQCPCFEVMEEYADLQPS